MAIVLFAAASNTQSGWQYIISSFLLALLVVGFIVPVFALKSLSLNKSVPSRLYVGKDSTIDLSVTNHSKLRKTFFDIVDAPLITEVDLFSSVNRLDIITFVIKKLHNLLVYKEYTSRLFLKVLPGKQIVEFGYDFVPFKRGVHRTGSLLVSSSSPLGLFSVSRSFNPNAEIIVFPRVYDIRGGWINRVSHKSVMSEFSYSYLPTSIPGTTRGLRAYVPGDSPRHIHWPTSAKTGKLLVREFEIESSGLVYIVLDSCSGYETEEYFELAISVVASMLNACHAEGLTAGFHTQSDAYDYQDNGRLFEWDTQMEILARLKPISRKPICKCLDSINQELISKNKAVVPTYILVSHKVKADESANKSNIISVTVSSRSESTANYSITSEADLKYV